MHECVYVCVGLKKCVSKRTSVLQDVAIAVNEVSVFVVLHGWGTGTLLDAQTRSSRTNRPDIAGVIGRGRPRHRHHHERAVCAEVVAVAVAEALAATASTSADHKWAGEPITTP